MNLSRDDIRNLVSCPACKQEAGAFCVGIKTKGRNHFERMHAAQLKAREKARARPRHEDSDVIERGWP